MEATAVLEEADVVAELVASPLPPPCKNERFLEGEEEEEEEEDVEEEEALMQEPITEFKHGDLAG